MESRDETGVDAGGELDRLGIDLEPVAPPVPLHDRLDVRRRTPEVSPVLVGAPFGERLGDARRGAEVHVRDPHPDLDVLTVGGHGPVPLRAVRPEPVVDLVEVVSLREEAVAEVSVRRPPGLGRLKPARADGAEDGGGSGPPEEGSAVERARR